MSKKCCGMIYSDDEKVCKVCGKPLMDEDESVDEQDDSEVDNSDEAEAEDSDEIEAEDSDEIEAEDSDEIETEDSDDDTETVESDVDFVKKHIEREAILDQIFDDNGFKKDDVIKEKKERTPFKALGIVSLLIAIAGMAAIGVLVYFIVLNPYYIKTGAAEETIVYPELSSDTDANEMSTLLVNESATDTDALEEIVQDDNTEEVESTNTDESGDIESDTSEDTQETEDLNE